MYPSNAMTGEEDGTEFRCRDPWCVREAMEPLHVLSASGMQPLKKSELSVKRYIQLRYPQNNNEKKIGAKTLLAHVRPWATYRSVFDRYLMEPSCKTTDRCSSLSYRLLFLFFFLCFEPLCFACFASSPHTNAVLVCGYFFFCLRFFFFF